MTRDTCACSATGEPSICLLCSDAMLETYNAILVDETSHPFVGDRISHVRLFSTDLRRAQRHPTSRLCAGRQVAPGTGYTKLSGLLKPEYVNCLTDHIRRSNQNAFKNVFQTLNVLMQLFEGRHTNTSSAVWSRAGPYDCAAMFFRQLTFEQRHIFVDAYLKLDDGFDAYMFAPRRTVTDKTDKRACVDLIVQRALGAVVNSHFNLDGHDATVAAAFYKNGDHRSSKWRAVEWLPQMCHTTWPPVQGTFGLPDAV